MRTLSLLISILFFSTCLVAQKSKKAASRNQLQNVSNIIKVGTNTFFDLDEFPFYINWETKIGTDQSVQIGVLPRMSKENQDKTSGIGISAAFRQYISKNRSGISGLFISPVVKVGFLNESYSYTSYYYTGNPQQQTAYTYSRSSKIKQYSAGFVFGHNWVFKSGFSFEASGGMGYYSSKEDYTTNNANTSFTSAKNNYSGILPQVQINFGYAF